MTCNHCGKENRPEARYCRFCGEAMATADNMQQGLVGKKSIAPMLEELDRKLVVARRFARSGTRIGLDCIILGDSGTGKSFLAHLIAEKMRSAGVAKTAPIELDAADWSDFCKDFDKNIAAL